MKKIIILDPKTEYLKDIALTLEGTGYGVEMFTDSEKVIQRIENNLVDLAIIETLSPSYDGFQICKDIISYNSNSEFPIILMNQEGSELDRVLALELGAIDFIKKPFNPRELSLRIRNIFSHRMSQSNLSKEKIIKIDGLTIDSEKRRITVGDDVIKFSNMEFNLLLYLARRIGKLQTRVAILQDVWGYSDSSNSRTVDTHIRRVREKIGIMGNRLETVRGFGYRFM